MGSFWIGFSDFTTAATKKTAAKAIGAAGKKFGVWDCAMTGSGLTVAAATQHEAYAAFLTNATAGTPGASPTPEKMDQGNPTASGLTAGVSYSVEPTAYATNQFVLFGFNQQGGMEWAVPVGSEAVFATEGSTINATDVDASGATIYGFQAEEGAKITASGGNANNAGTYGVWADGASTIEFGASAAGNATATGCGTTAILCENGSTVNARGTTVSNSPTGIEARQTGTINFRSGTATGCTVNAVTAIEGGIVTCNNATLTGAGVYGILSRSGTVTANSADCSTAGTTGVRIEVGGIVRFNSGTGTLSTAANAITSSGIIFQ